MSSIHFFPYDKIPKYAKVCLYGVGRIGKEYYEQNAVLEWCEMSFAVDRNYHDASDFPMPVNDPERIAELKDEFDYVLIAVHETSAKRQIREFLESVGVEDNRIISSTEEFIFKDDGDQIKELDGDSGESTLRLAWIISKAMGDQVISLKPYQALMELCPYIVADIYSNGSKTAESIYYGQPGVRNLKPENIPPDYSDYDLVIEVGFMLTLHAVRYEAIQRICGELETRIRGLQRYQQNLSADTGVYPYTSRIVMDRAWFLGRNRYTMLAEPNLFSYKDKKVQIYLNNDYLSSYHSLELGDRYITFNCEAGPAPGSGLRQIKEWPVKNYVSLIHMIKDAYPDIQIVQLGTCNAVVIEEADDHILGESLELVKYVLKGSLLHIDCESGLPHLATQLGTKCCVLFGPTPIWFIGYAENINIQSEICYGCMGLVSDWYSHCLKYDDPICMGSIRPDKVYEKIIEVI